MNSLQDIYNIYSHVPCILKESFKIWRISVIRTLCTIYWWSCGYSCYCLW